MGSSASRSMTNTDVSSSSTQVSGPSSFPEAASQFPRQTLRPPGVRFSGIWVKSSLTSRSPVIPPSRYSKVVSVLRGVMTNGGFDTSRSTGSLRGSRRDPCRNSIVVTPLSPAESSARRSALWEMSVAITRSLWRANSRAWIPQPVPMSAATPTCSRGVMDTNVRPAPPSPSTNSPSRTSGVVRVP